MDWTGCELVEIVPGKVSGVPLVKDTRIPADFVVESYALGLSVNEIRQDFPRLTDDVILQIVSFAQKRRRASVA
jgi:uncharacterized protein (DUF433 family)